MNITDRIELADLPRDPLNQLQGIRQKLLQVRNSARLSTGRAAKLRETLAFLLESLSEPVAELEVEVAPTPPVLVEKPVQKVTGGRKATAKIDKATV
jgi:hypothetical protein